MQKILITGGAGFIGSNLIGKLINKKYKIICIDNLNNYYNPRQKRQNIAPFLTKNNFIFYKADIANFSHLKNIFSNHCFEKIIHLAARAGVRASINKPLLYQKVNVAGTLNLLKLAKRFNIQQFIYGSTSSIYGDQKKLPFCETDPCNQPISPYAATKKSAELLCHTYAHLYKIKTTILRFFTVYGPKGRPDMAPYLFCQAILNKKPLQKFGNGQSSRDYTYVDDITDGILKAIKKPFAYEIINLGNSKPITLNKFIQLIEKTTGQKAIINPLPVRQGDVSHTFADIKKAKKLLNWQPKTDLKTGMKKFVDWYQKNIISD